MDVRQITEPSDLPLSLAELRAQLRLNSDFVVDDPYIETLQRAAVKSVEAHIAGPLVSRDFDQLHERFPCADRIVLARAPVTAIEGVHYTAEGAAEAVFAATDYVADVKARPGRVVLKRAGIWPSVALEVGTAVRIQFTAGYGRRDAVPEAAKQAIKLLVTSWYANREAVVLGHIVADLPFGVAHLLGPLTQYYPGVPE